MTRRWRLTWPGWGTLAIAAVMLSAGIMKTINLLIFLGDTLVALIVLNAVLATRNVRALEVLDQADREAESGVSTRATAMIASRNGRPATAIYREESDAHHAAAFIAGIASQSPEPVVFHLTPSRRGLFSMRRSLESGFPFGLVMCVRHWSDGGLLHVLPARGQIDADQFLRWLARRSCDTRGRRYSLHRGPSHADIRALRAFRGGDSPRHIHWRSTARRNELLVREFDSPDSPDLVLALELGTASAAIAEAAVSLAATILDFWCRREQAPRVTLILDQRPPLTARATPKYSRRLLRELATARTRDGFQIAGNCEPLRNRAVQLLVTTREEASRLPGQFTGHWQRVSPSDLPAWYHPPKRDGAS